MSDQTGFQKAIDDAFRLPLRVGEPCTDTEMDRMNWQADSLMQAMGYTFLSGSTAPARKLDKVGPYEGLVLRHRQKTRDDLFLTIDAYGQVAVFTLVDVNKHIETRANMSAPQKNIST